MAFRGCIPDFQTANPLYIGATVSFYTVNPNGTPTTTLALLYSDPTSATQTLNPQTLDSEGKFLAPVYIEVPVIAQVQGPNVDSHQTGVINARGTWRGSWSADTIYFSSDFVQDPASSNVYLAALDYTSSTTLAADVLAGDLVLVLGLSSINGTVAVKQACLAATTANITLSGTQTVDGVALVVGNRVLVKNQSTASQNGIYIVQAGAWTLATDFAQSNEVLSGCLVFVTTGTVNALSEWELTTPDPIVVGTTALTWSNNRTIVGTETVAGTINVTGAFQKSGTAQTFPISGSLVGTSDTQTLTNKTYSGGTLSGTLAGTPTLSGSNFITLANIAQAAAYTLTGNATGSTGNHTDFTIGSLTNKTTPGSTDQILISDQAASGALKYSTVGQILSGSNAMVLLNTLTASSSASLSDTTSFTATYSSYLLVFENIVPATGGGVSVELQVHSGGSFQSASYVTATNGFTNGGSAAAANNSTSFIPLSSASAFVDNLNGELRIFAPSGTSKPKHVMGLISYLTSSVANFMTVFGYCNINGAVDGFQLILNPGAIASGTVKIYGII